MHSNKFYILSQKYLNEPLYLLVFLVPRYRVVELRYPTNNYFGIHYGVPPMILDCSLGGAGTNTGIAVGFASKNMMDDLDFMICADFPQVIMYLLEGGTYCI